MKMNNIVISQSSFWPVRTWLHHCLVHVFVLKCELIAAEIFISLISEY